MHTPLPYTRGTMLRITTTIASFIIGLRVERSLRNRLQGTAPYFQAAQRLLESREVHLLLLARLGLLLFQRLLRSLVEKVLFVDIAAQEVRQDGGLGILIYVAHLIADHHYLLEGFLGDAGSDFGPDGVEEHRGVDEDESA
jgi:hypothetical protein